MTEDPHWRWSQPTAQRFSAPTMPVLEFGLPSIGGKGQRDAGTFRGHLTRSSDPGIICSGCGCGKGYRYAGTRAGRK
ncbi:MAG: hypothetical protein ACLTLQ_08885 [[Clostridium] scindens]